MHSNLFRISAPQFCGLRVACSEAFFAEMSGKLESCLPLSSRMYLQDNIKKSIKVYLSKYVKITFDFILKKA